MIGGVRVVNVGVILVGRVVIGHRDYSLTLIGCDSRVVICNWFDWESGDWL